MELPEKSILKIEKTVLRAANSTFKIEKTVLRTANTTFKIEKTVLRTANSTFKIEKTVLRAANSIFKIEKTVLRDFHAFRISWEHLAVAAHGKSKDIGGIFLQFLFQLGFRAA